MNCGTVTQVAFGLKAPSIGPVNTPLPMERNKASLEFLLNPAFTFEQRTPPSAPSSPSDMHVDGASSGCSVDSPFPKSELKDIRTPQRPARAASARYQRQFRFSPSSYIYVYSVPGRRSRGDRRYVFKSTDPRRVSKLRRALTDLQQTFGPTADDLDPISLIEKATVALCASRAREAVLAEQSRALLEPFGNCVKCAKEFCQSLEASSHVIRIMSSPDVHVSHY